MTSALGLVMALAASAVQAPFDAVFAWGVAAPPATFGLDGEALLASLLLFPSGLFGGYVGCELGEPTRPEVRRFGWHPTSLSHLWEATPVARLRRVS